jgi:serine protease Do
MKTTIVVVLLALPLFLFSTTEMTGYLGVSTQGLSEAMKIALELDHGVLVEKVHNDSPAEQAGILVGDIITEIDKAEISDYRTLKEAVSKQPNEPVVVTLYRKGKKMSQTVILGAREKSKFKLEVDIPDLPDLKVILGTKELQENIDKLTQEIEQLKKEVEQIKKQLK